MLLISRVLIYTLYTNFISFNLRCYQITIFVGQGCMKELWDLANLESHKFEFEIVRLSVGSTISDCLRISL